MYFDVISTHSDTPVTVFKGANLNSWPNGVYISNDSKGVILVVRNGKFLRVNPDRPSFKFVNSAKRDYILHDGEVTVTVANS